MKISRNWLADYFEDKLPDTEKLVEVLTMHAFEIEGVEKVGDDEVFDIKILPDRSHDCLSHRGIALEISLLTGAALDSKKTEFKEPNFPESNILKIEIEDEKLCKRFSAAVIENLEVKESPKWLKERLKALGQKSINNVVDATNYVMFSLGQPLHAYDLDLLKDGSDGTKLVARGAKKGEKLTTLDGKEYELTEEDFVIADGNSLAPLGFAGIKGGKATEISSKTKSIVLEAANFNAVAIRKNSKRLGLRTDASVRFENEITSELTSWALTEAINLILESAKSENIQVEGMVDVYPRRPAPFKVGVSVSEVNAVLGLNLSQKDIEEILVRRGYEFAYINPRDLIVKRAPQYIGVPYKFGSSVVYDAPKSFDCSSFASFLYAQAGIAIPRISVDQFVFGQEVEEKDALPGDLVFSNSGEGKIFKESLEWLSGTVVSEGVDHVGLYMGEGLVIHDTSKTGVVTEAKIKESESFKKIVGYRRLISNEENRFVVTVPAERLDLRIKEDLIEEIGRIYGYENLPAQKPEQIVEYQDLVHWYYENVIRKFLVEKGFSEIMTYTFREKGDLSLQNPVAKDRPFLRPNLTQGMSQAIDLNLTNKDLLGLEFLRFFEIGTVFRGDTERRSLAITCVGGDKKSNERGKEEVREVIGELEKELGTSLKLEEFGLVFEASLDELSNLPQPKEKLDYSFDDNKLFKEYSKYPVVLRDIAVFVPEGGDQNEIPKMVRNVAGALLANYRLFDTFLKDFPEGKKTSYAYRLVFQSFEKTLTDAEINLIMEEVTKKISQKEGWVVR